MTLREQQIAIMKVCGDGCGDCDHCVGGRPDQCAVAIKPNYLGDLNASHEMEKMLGSSEQKQYLVNLIFVVGSEFTGWEIYDAATATASQRAEAFLRTKGLWKEEA